MHVPFSGSSSLLLLQPQLSSLSVVVACSGHSMTAQTAGCLALVSAQAAAGELFPHRADSPAFCLLPSQTTRQKAGKERPSGDGPNAAVPGTVLRTSQSCLSTLFT